MSGLIRIQTALLSSLCLIIGGCDRSATTPAPEKTPSASSASSAPQRTPSKYDLSAKEVTAIKEAIATETEQALRGIQPPEPDDQYPDMLDYGFQAAKFDLNGDGTAEVLFRYEGFGFCGSGGCVFRVYEKHGDAYRKLSGTTLTFLPIGVAPTASHGWRDLMITVRKDYVASGIAPLRFNGVRYPLSWSNEPASDVGEVVLTESSPYYPLFDR